MKKQLLEKELYRRLAGRKIESRKVNRLIIEMYYAWTKPGSKMQEWSCKEVVNHYLIDKKL